MSSIYRRPYSSESLASPEQLEGALEHVANPEDPRNAQSSRIRDHTEEAHEPPRDRQEGSRPHEADNP